MGIKQNAISYFGQLNTKKILLAVVVSILAFLFTPGFLLNLPPVGPPNDDVKDIPSAFFSYKNNIYSILVHSTLIGLLFYSFISIKFFYNIIGIQSIL